MVKILRENNGGIKQLPVECIKGATLLSREEAENLLTKEERKCKGTQYATKNGLEVEPNGNSSYWLRSAGDYIFSACYVYGDGNVYSYSYVYDTYIGIRPVLIVNLSPLNLRVGDSFEFGSHIFKIISNNLALCDTIVDTCPFNKSMKDGNNYETSYIKTKVDGWLSETMGMYKGIKTNEMIEEENDLGF